MYKKLCAIRNGELFHTACQKLIKTMGVPIALLISMEYQTNSAIEYLRERGQEFFELIEDRLAA